MAALVAFAVRLYVSPFPRVNAVLFSVIPEGLTAAPVTVTLQRRTFPRGEVTLIVAVPGAFAVITPLLLTLTIEEFEDEYDDELTAYPPAIYSFAVSSAFIDLS